MSPRLSAYPSVRANPAALALSSATAAKLLDIWVGPWKLIVRDKTYSLKMTDTSIGAVGGVINGALTFDNMICVASGVWYVSLAGLYPDENRIVSINLNRLMNWTATCPDGRKANADMYFVPGGDSIVGAAGRIQWTDAAGKPLSAEMATLKR